MKKKTKARGAPEQDWRSRIVSAPGGCHGRPCVASYPSLSADDVQAALAYAAELARGAVLTA